MMIIVDALFWIVGKIFYIFTWYIDLCDAALTVAVVYNIMRDNNWSKGWALALGLLIALIVYVIFQHRIGFWVISVVFSCLWGFSITLIAYGFSMASLSERTLWIIGIVAFAFSVFLHGYAKFRPEIIADEAAARKATNNY